MQSINDSDSTGKELKRFPQNFHSNLNPLASGESVIDCRRAPVATDPSSWAAINAALSTIDSGSREDIEQVITFPHFVGATNCVATTENDLVFWACPLARLEEGSYGMSRIVMDRLPELSPQVYIRLHQVSYKEYNLLAGHIGGKVFTEMYDYKAIKNSTDPEKAAAEASVFWESHAYIYLIDELDLCSIEWEPDYLRRIKRD